MPDILGLIPDDLKNRMRDALVDMVAGQAGEYLGQDAAHKLRGLRTDGAFLASFDAGLQRALQRFVVEYKTKDEALVAAIAADSTVFHNAEIETALLTTLKRPGSHLAAEREHIIQTFASVLPERRDRARVDQAVTYLLSCLAEELWHLPELQPVYSLHFQKGSYEAQRQQVELQRAQLLALSTMNTNVREALLQLSDAIAERKLLLPVETAGLVAPPRVLHNLPQPEYGKFVGREKELAQVFRILRPYPYSQSHMVTIDGIGGIGKSTLALEVAYHYLRNHDQLPVEERFGAIIWATAKKTVLTGEGILTRRQILRNLDDLYTTIAIALQREDITGARPDEQDEIVRQALTRQRTLIIVDNLETVDDEQVLTFLRELPAPTKAIVTTRHRIDVAYPLRLMGMPWEDMQILIRQECERKQVSLTEDQAHHLYDSTGGVPLAIVWSIAQMGFGYGIDIVLHRLSQPVSDVARYCFVASVSGISGQPAEKLLWSLSLFAKDATREAVGKVSGVPLADRDDGLVILERLSLINRSDGRFSLLPLTGSFVNANLQSNVHEERVLKVRYIEYYLNLTHELGGESKDYGLERLRQFAALDRDLPNIRLAIAWSYQLKMWPEVGQFAVDLAEFLDHYGFWNDNIVYGEMGVEAGRKTGDDRLVMQLKNYVLGWQKIVRFGKIEEGTEAVEEALRLAIVLKDRKQYAIALRNLGVAHRDRGDFEKSIPLFLESRAILADLGEHRQETIAIGNLAESTRNQGRLDLAVQYCREAIAQARTTNNPDLLGLNLRRLSNILASKGEYEEAHMHALESLAIYHELDIPRNTARTYQTLANIEMLLGRIQDAREHASLAYQMYSELGLRQELGQTEQLLAQINDKAR